MTWEQFILSPGAGGAGALLAALVIGGSAVAVSLHRRTEASNALAETKRQAALERWWTQYTWLVSVTADAMPIEGRAAFLLQLRSDAVNLNADELIAAADGYRAVVNRWLASALSGEAH